MISIVNIRVSECDMYIGRRCSDHPQSVLANPYRIGVDGDRVDVVRKYRVWIWKQYQSGNSVTSQINHLAYKVHKGNHVRLGCWCHPQTCHGDIVRDLVEYVIEQLWGGGE